MKKARLAVLGVAILAAGGAALVMKNMSKPDPKPVAVEQSRPAIQLEEVLVADIGVKMGDRLTGDKLRWQEWPADAVSANYITKSSQPDALSELEGVLARTEIYGGEPVVQSKIVKGDSRVMSAILPKGQRAVSTSISVATGAGGFILPNDRVDVLMTTRVPGSDLGYSTEIILENVRVLAIDQQITEKDGMPVAVGETATLQLSPDQVEILAVAQQTAEKLSLSLRSLADINEPAKNEGTHLLSGGRGSVRMIRYGRSHISSVNSKGKSPSSDDTMSGETQ